jgi:uncharacterized membrane protein HdeD (DUF308 family)
MAEPLRDRGEATSFALVEAHTVREGRGWFIGIGLAFVVLGLLAIFLPFAASLVTTLVIGWLMVIGGVVQGVHALQNRRWAHSGWAVAGAIVQVVAGVLVVIFPLTGTIALTLILAAFFAAEGAFKIIRAVQHRAMPAWGWLLFDGILCLGIGFLILARWPSTSVWAIGLLVGVNFLVGGSSMLLLGITARHPLAARP